MSAALQAARGSISAQPMSEPAFRPCPVCGAPVARGRGRTPRVYCEASPCKEAANHQNGLVAALRQIVWPETPAGHRARRGFRAAIVAAANRIPHRWHRPRDARGRFERRSA